MAHKILIVEDNEMNRDMLSRRLTRKGYEISLAEDGAMGLESMGTDRPDLVLRSGKGKYFACPFRQRTDHFTGSQSQSLRPCKSCSMI